MFGFGSKEPIEKEMTEWLAHPSEFGEQPKSVNFKRTYKGRLVSLGKVEIHLVEYEMPDGTKGRGFVNGGLTWSFLGDEVNAIADDDLLLAYCGWAWLFPALQSGGVETDFQSDGEESRLLAASRSLGIEALELGDRYRIGTSELYEFKGIKDSVAVKGAGDSESQTIFSNSEPQYALPSIYFHLGRQVIESMR